MCLWISKFGDNKFLILSKKKSTVGFQHFKAIYFFFNYATVQRETLAWEGNLEKKSEIFLKISQFERELNSFLSAVFSSNFIKAPRIFVGPGSLDTIEKTLEKSNNEKKSITRGAVGWKRLTFVFLKQVNICVKSQNEAVLSLDLIIFFISPR